MEEVIGSIPIRSTNYFSQLGAPPFRDFVANFKTTPRVGFACPVATSPAVLIESAADAATASSISGP